MDVVMPGAGHRDVVGRMVMGQPPHGGVDSTVQGGMVAGTPSPFSMNPTAPNKLQADAAPAAGGRSTAPATSQPRTALEAAAAHAARQLHALGPLRGLGPPGQSRSSTTSPGAVLFGACRMLRRS